MVYSCGFLICRIFGRVILFSYPFCDHRCYVFLHSYMTLSSAIHIALSSLITYVIAINFDALFLLLSLLFLIAVVIIHLVQIVLCIKAKSLPSNLREFAYSYGKIDKMNAV